MSKLHHLDDMVRSTVRDGDTVFVGGFGQNVPFALGFEIIRQQKQSLVLCRTGADILFDLMIAAGCVSGVIVGWIGNPGIGLSHAFTRALKAGTLKLEETSNFGLLLRLIAGRMGLPYLPTRSLLGGDIPSRLKTMKSVSCPFTGEKLAAVRALTPDVAILHAQRSDESGNVQSWGILGDSVEGALAARRIIVTVEEIVSTKEITSCPERTILPAHRVESIAPVPFGSYPSYCQDYYGRDDIFYRNYDSISRDIEKLKDWIDCNITETSNWSDYLKRVGPKKLRSMIAAAERKPPARWVQANVRLV